MSFWDFVPDIITVGASLWGADQQQKANTQSAEVAAQANTQSAEQLLQAQQEATAAQQAGIEAATDVYQMQRADASPGLIHNQNIIGRGADLIPAQQRALDEARRTTIDSLHGGALRGSARATAATVGDVEGRMRDSYLEQNRNRADQAASNLSGQYFNAGSNEANMNLQTGNTASQGLINTGQITSSNTQEQAKNTINANQNTASIKGAAIGDISAVIADQVKQNRIKASTEIEENA